MKKKYLWCFIFFGKLRLHFSPFSAMAVTALAQVL